jgi:hypothetical protein
MIVLPDGNIRVLEPVAGLDYFDLQSITLPCAIRPLDAWNTIMADPQPLLRAAFRTRDFISGFFGVRKIVGFSGASVESAQVGDRLDFFLVEHVDDTVLVLTERDRHLDVMTCLSSDGNVITVTSSVRVHNWFGHAYMLPVGIAHKWIVRSMLKKLLRKTAAVM